MKKKKEGVQRSHDRCEGRGGEPSGWGGGGGRGACQARHPWAYPARHLGPPSIKLVGWPRALKKLKFGLARSVD